MLQETARQDRLHTRDVHSLARDDRLVNRYLQSSELYRGVKSKMINFIGLGVASLGFTQEVKLELLFKKIICRQIRRD